MSEYKNLKRKPTLFESISCFVFLAVVVGVGFAVFEIPVQPLLLVAAAYAAFIAMRVGLSWRQMEEGITERLKTAMPAIFIIFAVGVIVGTWIYSGTVPMLIYYGLLMIDPSYFLVAAFVITAIVSVATGTAWGSSATAGVALMGISNELGIPAGIAAGAIISGAVFGDKLSPLSDTTNLAPLVVNIDLYDHIKHMLWTTIPASVVGLIIWFFVGLNIDTGTADSENVQNLLNELSSIFNWNIFMLLPFILILWGAFRKKPIVPVMLLSSLVAVIIGTLSNGFSIVDGFIAMADGFMIDMVPGGAEFSETTLSLLTHGGIFSMTTIVVTIFCGYAFAGIVEVAGCLDRILEALHNLVKTPWQLTGVTILGSLAVVFTAGVASISIIMVGVLMKKAYLEQGLHEKNLSRTLEDSGTMVLGFVPWGVSAVYYLEVLGVGVGDYWMWAIPCYLCIVFAMIYAITGIGMAKTDKKPEEA